MFIMLAAYLVTGPVTLKPLLELGPLPEALDLYLEGASKVEVWEDGHFYMLDTASSKVFVWDEAGRYRNHFGNRGEGPGEFGFRPRAGQVGHLSVFGGKVAVYDAGLRRLTIFTPDGAVVRVNPIQAPVGSIYGFYMIAEDRFVLDTQNRNPEGPSRDVSIYDTDGAVVRTIVSVPDGSFEQQTENGRVSGLVFKVFTPILATTYDAIGRNLIYGVGDRAAITLHHVDSGEERTIAFPGKRYPVTDEDRDEYDQIQWIKQNDFFSAVFADTKPYFNSIRHVAGQGFLVFNISPFYMNVNGLLIDEEGEVLSEVQLALGEDGTLYSSRGRLIQYGLDEAGDYQTRVVALEH